MEEVIPLRSGFLTSIRLLGPSQRRLGGFVSNHRLARSLEVAAAEFLVQQNIIIGFLLECFPIISGSLDVYDSFSDRIVSNQSEK
jgi:hypothetical protein